jgi:putative ABC transport system permease protein
MLKNYLIVALRNFNRNRIFSAINILGLVIGISASLLISFIVHYSYSFDRFEKNPNRIFRVVSDFTFQGDPSHNRGVPAPLSDAVRQDLSGIDNLVSFRYYNPEKIVLPNEVSANKTAVNSAEVSSARPSSANSSSANKTSADVSSEKKGSANTAATKPAMFKYQAHVIFADANYFDLLPYRWIAGNKQSALSQEGQVVLSESRAKIYFPNRSFADMIGQPIVYDDSIATRVSGIVADLDQQGNTDFNFLEFISLNTILKNSRLQKSMYWTDWGSTTSDQQLYVQLSPNTTAASVEKKLKGIFDKHLGEDAKKNNYTCSYSLQPLLDIHFNDNYGTFDSLMANKSTLLGLILTATFLIGIACINFINLTTANAAQRAKEIGVRKTMGSTRGQLVVQFLGETFLIMTTATLLSVLLVPLIGKLFSSFIPEGTPLSVMTPFALVFLSILLIVVSLLAGFYPAWVLSSSNALETLKNRAYAGTNQTRTAWLRKGLTVSQFVIAQFFVIGTLMVSKQIHFMMNKDLGFSKQAILSVQYPSSDHSIEHKKYVLQQFNQIAGVQRVVQANDLPSSNGWWTSIFDYAEDRKPVQSVGVELKSCSAGYLELLKIPLLAGRDLVPSDTCSEILINETYLHTLGFKQPADVLGKMLKYDDKHVPIVGVFRDFHAHPLNFKIAPMVILRSAEQNHGMLASLPADKSRWPGIIAEMKKTWLSIYPDEEFKSEFLDERIARAYFDVQQTSTLLQWAMGLTIFISCLGLLGLVIYTTNHRKKEIGIRKVLGASVAQIMTLLSGDFIRLVAIAFLIATPLAWWAIHSWLDDFVFRTSASWWVFIVSGVMMIIIALLTLSVQTMRTAMANPVSSLRSE